MSPAPFVSMGLMGKPGTSQCCDPSMTTLPRGANGDVDRARDVFQFGDRDVESISARPIERFLFVAEQMIDTIAEHRLHGLAKEPDHARVRKRQCRLDAIGLGQFTTSHRRIAPGWRMNSDSLRCTDTLIRRSARSSTSETASRSEIPRKVFIDLSASGVMSTRQRPDLASSEGRCAFVSTPIARRSWRKNAPGIVVRDLA